MPQYKKLFDKSEIEYITPFLKLWMAFNNWYKQDLSSVLVKVYDKDGNIKKNSDGTDKEKNITTDSEAINYYKTGGQIKAEFVKLLNSRSPNDEPFQNGLSSFVKLIKELKNSEYQFSNDLFYQNPTKTTITSNSLIYISPAQKEFYYSSTDEDRLFEETLTLIYKIRCSLIHGDFDIDDRIFIGLVESSYKILYPIMDRILQTHEIYINLNELALFFETNVATIKTCIDIIYKNNELNESITSITKLNTNGNINKNCSYYNIDVVIALSYHLNSETSKLFKKNIIQNKSTRLMYESAVQEFLENNK